MKLVNTKEHPLAFEVDGAKYTARPFAPVEPDMPLHKVAGVLKIAHLPVKLAEPEAPPSAPAPKAVEKSDPPKAAEPSPVTADDPKSDEKKPKK